MIVKTRENKHEGGLDVALLDLTREETIVVREALSDVKVNRDYAKRHGGTVLDALRQHPAMQAVHAWYKRYIRDVAHYPAPTPKVVDYDAEFSGWK